MQLICFLPDEIHVNRYIEFLLQSCVPTEATHSAYSSCINSITKAMENFLILIGLAVNCPLTYFTNNTAGQQYPHPHSHTLSYTLSLSYSLSPESFIKSLLSWLRPTWLLGQHNSALSTNLVVFEFEKEKYLSKKQQHK